MTHPVTAALPQLHHLFGVQASLTPDLPALVGLHWTRTYRELSDRADQFAARLTKRGVVPGDLIGLLLPRSEDAVASILAVLRVGGIYVPLDLAHPTERLRYMVENAEVRLVVSRLDLASRAEAIGVACLLLDDPREPEALPGPYELVQPSPVRPAASRPALSQPIQGYQDAQQVAYVMYTSGSTGLPKGVPITHAGVANLVFAQSYCPFGPSRVHLLLSNLSFDFSTLELWGALLHGGCLAVYEDTFVSLTEIGRVIQTLGVSTLMITPSLFNLLVSERLQDLGGLKNVLLGGDIPSVRTAHLFLKAVPECALTNVYGPTENAVFTTCFTLRSADIAPGSELGVIPIGRPIGGTFVQVMDEQGQPVRPGEEGELWLGGVGLTPGYLNRADLNAQAFVQQPIASTLGSSAPYRERLYKTGDLARERPDGELVFRGRRDLQIKLRGYRVELGEIESVLREQPGVREAAVVVDPGQQEGDEKRLVAYVHLNARADSGLSDTGPADTGPEAELLHLRGVLAARLPSYMQPAALIQLEQLPINPSGKLDRRALAALPFPAGFQVNTSGHAPGEPTAKASALNTHLDGLELDTDDAPISAMTTLWQEVLGVPVAPDDDFFYLGGTSLQAALLLTRIASRFGSEIHADIFFNRPTARNACALLTQERSEQSGLERPANVVSLREGNPALTPLFVLGDPFMYRLLAARVQSGGAVWAIHEALGPIEKMATLAIANLRRMQPHGPYRLTGFSFDGLVAYEVACQLAAQGEETELLALLDSGAPEMEHFQTQTATNVWQRIRLHVRYSRRMPSTPERLRYLVERARNLLLVKTQWQQHDLKYEELIHHVKPYRPASYAGTITLYRATGEHGNRIEPLMGWDNYAAQTITVHEVPGFHLDLVRVPASIQELGRLLSATLKTLDERPSGHAPRPVLTPGDGGP